MNKDYCVPRRFYEGDDLYDTIWPRISGLYNEQLERAGMQPGSHVPLWIEVDMEVVDGEEKPWPLTTHDESIRGNGCLADGTPLGSPEAGERTIANRTQAIGVTLKRLGVKGAEKKYRDNVLWNWTKGHAAQEGESYPDVIFRLGDRVSLPTFSADRARCRWPVPTKELKDRLDREKKKGHNKAPDPFRSPYNDTDAWER